MNIKNKEKHQLRKNVNGYVAHSKTLKIPSNIFSYNNHHIAQKQIVLNIFGMK